MTNNDVSERSLLWAWVFCFKHSPIETTVGCTKIPIIGQRFCADHQNASVPSIPVTKMEKDNVRKLRSSVKSVKEENTEDDVFNIVGLHGKKRSKKKDWLYLVEWEGYSDRTWEPAKNIPKFIVDFYERTGQSAIPKPRVKTVKKAGSATYFLLSWDGSEEGDLYVPQEDFAIGDEGLMADTGKKCNTQKH